MKTSKTVVQRPYPSEFGSHSSMIDEAKTQTQHVTYNVSLDNVICKDQFGHYETEKWRIDNGLADPNRWNGSRIKIEK